jgi:hypothetical protein
MAADSGIPEELREQYERVYGRPLAAACFPGCTCGGVTNREDLDERHDEPAMAGR